MWKVLFFLGCSAYSTLSWKITELNTPIVGAAHSPYWDDKTQSLYFVNFITNGKQSSIFCYNFVDGIFYSAYIEGITSPSFIIPINKKCNKCVECNSELFAVGVGSNVVIIKWNGRSTSAKVISPLIFTEIGDDSSRFDVAVADSHGRFYGGTVAKNFCNSTASRSLYRYTTHDGLVRLMGGLQSTTGIIFNEYKHKMYHFDSCQFLITEYDYDSKTGDICNGRVVYKFDLGGIPRNSYFPIGLDMDKFGFLYTAVYSGEVWKIDPETGNVVDKYRLPQPGAAGLTFGGPHNDILYVVMESSILDVISATVVKEITNGTSIYAITGLVGRNAEKNRLNIKCKTKQCDSF